jgi:hypothetical protein
MPKKGHIGTSMGGRVVRREQLKAKPTLPPVKTDELDVEARARRDAYAADREVRKQRVDRAAASAAAARQADADDTKTKGKRILNAGEAVSRMRGRRHLHVDNG